MPPKGLRLNRVKQLARGLNSDIVETIGGQDQQNETGGRNCISKFKELFFLIFFNIELNADSLIQWNKICLVENFIQSVALCLNLFSLTMLEVKINDCILMVIFINI